MANSAFRRNNYSGVWVRAEGDEEAEATITASRFEENGQAGVYVWDASATVRRTIAEGNQTGVSISGSSTVDLGTSSTDRENILQNNGSYDVRNNTSNTISAIGNFWGLTDASAIDARIYDDDERSSAGPVLFEPFLNEEPDLDDEPGLAIASVEPNPVIGSDAPQPFTINGSGFETGANVTLRDLTYDEVFPNRAVETLTSTEIVINPTFTSEPATWSVEVINPGGESTGQFVFEVVASGGLAITSVSPDPAVGSNADQPLTVRGSGFEPGAFVILDDLDDDQPPFENPDKTTFVSDAELVRQATFTPTTATWTAVVENPDGSQSAPFTFEVLAPDAEVNVPRLTASAASIPPGQSVQITGTRFTPGGSVELSVVGPAPFETVTQNRTASGDGSLNYTFASGGEPSGRYTVSALDVATGQSATRASFRVQQAPPEDVAAFRFIIPSEGESVLTGRPFQVQWQDELRPGAAYPTEGAQRTYSYTLEFSNDGGTTWQMVEDGIEGSGRVGSITTITAELQVDVSVAEARLRVTDEFQPQRKAVSPPFELTNIQPVANDLRVDLLHDYSYPNHREPSNRAGEVFGVAADGVSRIYLKVSNEGEGTIEEVTVRIADGRSGNRSNTRETIGAVKRADDIGGFSPEANDASETEATRSTANDEEGNYWFWYVAPEAFSTGAPGESDEAIRRVTATVEVTFAGEASPVITERTIRVVRPPLLLVHGLAGNYETWDDFRPAASALPFVYDRRFIAEEAVNIDKSGFVFTNAANYVLAEEGDSNYGSSVRKLIVEMRNKGYAANQALTVGHSMGGLVLRQAAELQDYQQDANYQQGGFFDRIITIGTPHLGSPWADLLEDVASEVTDILAQPVFSIDGLKPSTAAVRHFALWLERNQNDTDFLPGSLLRTVSAEGDPDGFAVIPTEAIGDLKASAPLTFSQTDVPTHLISTDLHEGDQNLPDVPIEVVQIVETAGDIFELGDRLLDMLSLLGIDVGDVLGDISGFDKAKRVVQGTELTLQAYTGGAFLVNSDVFVSTESQLAGLSRDGTAQTTVVDGVLHVANPFSTSQTNSPVIGAGVDGKLALHPINEAFGPLPPITGPARSAALASRASQHRAQSLSDAFEEAPSLRLLAPAERGAETTTGELLNVEVAVSDTVGLEFVKVRFQGEVYYSREASYGHVFSLPVTSAAVDSQRVEATALYGRDGFFLPAADAATVFVSPSQPPEAFEVAPLVQELRVDEFVMPRAEATFPNAIAKVSGRSEALSVSIEDPSVAAFDTEVGAFEGRAVGETAAVLSYRGVSDTLYIVVGTPDDVFIPVELTDFTAVASGDDVVLEWQTASETNNAGFAVEQRTDETWEQVAFVDGAGTLAQTRQYRHRVPDLAPGTHAFRLKQTDFDGSFEYSPEVEASVTLAVPVAVSELYPNPTPARAAFTLAVREAQHVRISIYDVLGRRVAVLHDGPLKANEQYQFTFNSRALASGLYFVQVKGEGFTKARKVMVVR